MVIGECKKKSEAEVAVGNVVNSPQLLIYMV